MSKEILRQLDFDLAYLALLTQRGIKPLSRWEAPGDPHSEELLSALGLRHRRIDRMARNGKEVAELVFSTSRRLIDEYAFWFDGKQLGQPPGGARAEGSLFGYPDCCVESFVARGYARNRLSRSDQRILFHWACPDCRVSPGLVPVYRQVYDECRRAFGPWPLDLRVGPYAQAVHQRVSEVGSWAALLLAMGAFGGALPNDGQAQDLSHMLVTTNDVDTDGLKDSEEWFFRTAAGTTDTDGNGFPDGYDVARRLWQQINALPTSVGTNAPYALWAIAKGLVLCDVCGEPINMGYLTVINPVEKTEVRFPILAMHYMEHGGFSHRDSQTNETHTGRVDPIRADIVVNNHPAPQMSAGQGTVTLHWHGLSNTTYQVSTKVDLAAPWTPGPHYLGADARLKLNDTNVTSVAQKFYRLSW